MGVTLVVVLACGGEHAPGGGGDALSSALTTKTDAYSVRTLDGKGQTIAYAIDLPADYERGNVTSSQHIWHVKGRRSPTVRVGSMKTPASFGAAVSIAKNGINGTTHVLHEEQTDTNWVVVARSPDGKWTQVDGWALGKDRLMPHCWIVLADVPADSLQIEWARRVAKSLKSIDPSSAK